MVGKVSVLGGMALAGAALVCPACVNSTPSPEAEVAQPALADAAVAKLDVRGMTCGSCATTARVAFERIDGVHDAEVSLETSSAVVRYDGARTQPARFIPEFERMTGYQATVVDDRSARAADATDGPASDGSASASTSSTTTAPALAPSGAER